MKDFIGLESYIDEEYARRIDHRFHSKGCAPSPDIRGAENAADELARKMSGRQPYMSQTDLCWVVLLYKCGAIDAARAAKLIGAIRETWDSEKGISGEERILDALDGDMDLASTVNYGRTLQEPMYRLRQRDYMLEIFDDYLALLAKVHELAGEHLDTIMIGQTHMNHGQPITLAHYLVSVFDGVYRGLEQFEQAYAYTNKNTGGCGSCAGTTWRVDRALMADLLGMDGVVEPTFDCESSRDHCLAILFSLSNTAIHISRYAMNQYIWALDEVDMLRSDPSLCGVSSFMPQKCDSGSMYEKVRMYAAEIMGEANKAMLVLRGEPHMDTLTALSAPNYAESGMHLARKCLRLYKYCLDHLVVQKERMLEIVREGYSCSTELVTYLVREHGYGGRLAHSIVATMVRQARQRGLKAYECTGEMLDAAADYLNQRKPGVSTAAVQECFDPIRFIHSHDQLGGTAPKENARLLNERRQILDAAIERYRQRLQRKNDGLARLQQQADAIVAASK
jgi:argininosuccinate lyase